MPILSKSAFLRAIRAFFRSISRLDASEALVAFSSLEVSCASEGNG
jgi:hypothetical protein